MLFQLTGAGAIELALKTSHLATGRPVVVGFGGGYHGTGLGALAPGGWPEFRDPFRAWLAPARIEDYGVVPELDASVACVVVEPMQGRGGVVEPPPGFLAGLRDACDRAGALLVVDEVFTGLGRTGTMWMCQALDVRPDLLVCGKALAGGLPLSACLGDARADGPGLGRARRSRDRHPHPSRQPALVCGRAGGAGRDRIASAAAAGAGAGAGGARRRCPRCADAGWRWACPAMRRPPATGCCGAA